MKEQIEKQFNITLIDKISYSEKTVYAGYLYFFKKELKQDHYFTISQNQSVYILHHNKDNYDPSITETGRFPDSFKIPFESCEKITLNTSIYPLTPNECYLKSPTMQIIEDIEQLLTQINNKLNQLK